MIAACALSVTATDKDFQPLFNGKDLTGWQGMGGPMTNWEIKDGVLSCTGKGGSAWLATKEEFANFELQLEYNIPENGNSGVFIRAPKNGAPWVAGLEIQVLMITGPNGKASSRRNLPVPFMPSGAQPACSPKRRRMADHAHSLQRRPMLRLDQRPMHHRR